MKKILCFALVAALMIAMLAACGGGSSDVGDDDTLYIGLSIRGLENPYYVQILEGAEMFAEAMLPAGSYEIRVMESQGSDDKQINDIKAFLAAVGTNAILYVDPNNAPNAAVIAEMCEEAGVYWNTTWSYADGVFPWDYEYYVMHQTADNEMGGYAAAAAMFDRFETPGTGKIVAILGMLTNDASIDREKGLMKALDEYPNVELLDIQPGNWSPQEALTLIQTWLAQYGDEIDGVWVANDSMALAVAEALRAEGLNGVVLVTGYDCIDDVIPAIEQGDVYATYASNPYLQAGFGLAYTYAAYSGAINPSELPREQRMFHTIGLVVSGANIDEYKYEYIENKPVFDYTDLESCISQPFDFDNLKY